MKQNHEMYKTRDKKLASWVGNDKTSFHTEFQPQVQLTRGVQGSKGSVHVGGGIMQEGWEEEKKGDIQKTVQESWGGVGCR